MKRKIILGTIIILGFLLVAFLSFSPDSGAPRFVPLPAEFKIDKPAHMTHNFLLPSPFENGLVWISSFGTNAHSARTYLYDVDRKKALGELMNGWPIFGNRDQTKVLLNTRHRSSKTALLTLLDRITGGKLKLSSQNREESFAVFDRNSNKTKGVGFLYQYSGAGSRWYPSPSFRYGFTHPTASPSGEVFLCDLEKSDMRKLTIHGTAVGWWNETSILYKSDAQDFSLYNVVTDQTSVLLAADEIKEFLKQRDLKADLSAGDVKPFPTWDEREYQFYFTDTLQRWKATNCFLSKMEKPSGKLKLIASDFKFQWSDSFDPTGRYYIFSGRDAGAVEKVSAVYVRDLQTGTTRTLVEGDQSNQHSIPLLHGNDVIYSRSNMLWRISLFDTNASSGRVFPPPAE